MSVRSEELKAPAAQQHIVRMGSLVIGHWLLEAGLQPCIAERKSRLLLNMPRSEVPKTLIKNRFLIPHSSLLTPKQEVSSCFG